MLWSDTWLVSGKSCSAWRRVMQFLPRPGTWELRLIMPIIALYKPKPRGPHTQRFNKNTRINNPIRYTINWKNAPTYKTAKFLVKFLHRVINLPNAYNIKNSLHFLQDLSNIPILKLCSFDVTNIYTNISFQVTKIISEIFQEQFVTRQHNPRYNKYSKYYLHSELFSIQ
jgi:hypothetical protein